MNLESDRIEPNYIKLDFKNSIKFINEKDINEENLDLEAVIESFTQQITLEELNSFIYKLIPKNINDIYKLNIEQSKQYIKKYPYTEENLIDSVNRILASDFKSNFVFNKQNLEDVCRIISHAFSSIKKFDIHNEKNLLERIKNIKLNEKDIFNMYIDIEMMNEKKSERTRIRKILRAKFYGNQNPIYFNSTGNLPMINSLKKEENDTKTSKSRKKKSKLYEKYSLINENNNEIEDENEGEGEITYKFKKVVNKIKQKCGLMDDTNKNSGNNNQIKINNKRLLNEDNKILVTKEYFIYPENNYGLNNDKNLELPLELIILLKKFEKIKILTFQIRDTDEKSVKENIYLLLNLNLLFPNFSELKIDFNDEELQKKLNNIYEMRGQILYYKFKKDLRVVQYLQDYKARTVNCWEPEGDIIFLKEDNNDNDIKYKYTSFGNDYILGENPFENSDFFGNNLKKIIDNNDNSYYNIPDKIINIGYILPKEEGNNNSIKNEIIDEYEDDISDEDSSICRSFIGNRTSSEYQRYENKSFIAPIIKNKSLTNLESQLLIKPNNHGKRKRKRTTPEMLYLFIKENISPFEMIFIYSYFLDKISKLKTLSLYFNDSYSLETEFFLKNEDSKFDGFHFLFFINRIKQLNEVNISFNSLDNRTFENILGIIAINENISILRINFFTPDINYNIASLLKLCSMMKLSLQALFKEQIINYINERNEKDLEMEYFILNHKLDFFYEKNICCLFNIIKKNINNYEEIVFRFDWPLLLLTCDKYIIIIIKFIMNMINLITYIKNKIKIFKIISPELILNGKITPSLKYLFKELNTYNNNNTLKELTLRCKISGIPNIFNICFNGLTSISIGDLDFESFNGFLNDYKKNINKMTNLISLKIGINNTIISYEKIENKIKEFIDTNSINLKEKILFSFLEMETIEQINDLRIYVQRSKIEKLVIQISSNNSYLLNSSEMEINEKNNIELKSLYFIMTKDPYKQLAKTKIINNLRKFFKKNRHKIVVCKPYFPSYDL